MNNQILCALLIGAVTQLVRSLPDYPHGLSGRLGRLLWLFKLFFRSYLKVELGVIVQSIRVWLFDNSGSCPLLTAETVIDLLDLRYLLPSTLII